MAAEQFRVREMTLRDVPAVVEIDQRSFSLPWPESSFRFELQENPAAFLLVAERVGPAENALVGYIGFWSILEEAHISTLAVHPLERGKGIAARLLKEALRRADEMGALVATLEVRVSNQAAIRLYRKFGFEIVGKRKRYYYDNGEDALIMTLGDLSLQPT